MIVKTPTVRMRAPEKPATSWGLRWGRAAAIWSVFLTIATAMDGAAHAEEPIVVLHTHDEEIGSDILEESPAVGAMRCIFRRLGRRVDIRRAPRIRNRELLKSGRIDGIFPNLPDPLLDTLAVPTAPFVLERWSYIQLKSSANSARPRDETVGVVLGSNESRLLAQEGGKFFDAIPNMESLVKLLVAERLPFVMVDEWSFESEATAMGYSRDRFRSSIVRYVPLQLYFSKSFVAANPTFISLFNGTIKDCVHGARAVASWEREILLAEARKIIDGAHDELVDRIKRFRTLDALDPLESRVETLAGDDEDWQAALNEDRTSTLMEIVLSNPLSEVLRDVAAEHPTITEIFVTNEDGFIIGLNRLTSDYWQGDENAAEAVLASGAQRHFSNFEYDTSTKRFQVKVSLAIHDGDEGAAPIGMVTIGIDAARLLAGHMH
ncbi:hypothetical protein EOI86_06750 [Hwanghaeella grinnelliae]|uniref:Transporter substrate-binding domain-containing protein n=1 Tax=Hwanghaeella grinnelliae TaxID=2500179 RepID=A0A3S2ZBT0_9PROT|nr:cache domain-containing protein [Hwanghaeella grinnelliae]RVU38957.1 hypothetical protein EOI86_06750 [Hwanghaeella grinnelliae]